MKNTPNASNSGVYFFSDRINRINRINRIFL